MRRIGLPIFVAWFTVCISAAALGQTDDPPTTLPERELMPIGTAAPTSVVSNPDDSSMSVGSWGWQTAGALIIVIALIYGLRIVLRRATGQASAGTGRGLVEVLARASIGHKTQVLFLRVSDRVIIAGQTPAGLNTLATVDQPEDVAGLLAHVQASKPNSISQSFTRLLNQADRGFEGAAETEGHDEQEHLVDRTHNDVSSLLGRLRHLNRRDP